MPLLTFRISNNTNAWSHTRTEQFSGGPHLRTTPFKSRVGVFVFEAGAEFELPVFGVSMAYGAELWSCTCSDGQTSGDKVRPTTPVGVVAALE